MPCSHRRAGGVGVPHQTIAYADGKALGGLPTKRDYLRPSSPYLAFNRSGLNITLAWPSDPAGFILESSDILPANTWTPVAGVVNNQATINVAAGKKFYRLRKP